MLDTQSLYATIRSEQASSLAGRFLLTPVASSQSHIVFVGQGPSTALRLAELACSQRQALAVGGLWRFYRKGTGKMNIESISYGAATFTLQPRELDLLSESIHLALDQIVEAERSQGIDLLGALHAAFTAASLAGNLQLGITPTLKANTPGQSPRRVTENYYECR